MNYKERERLRLKNRMKAIWDGNREQNLCGVCGDKPLINPKTGKPYAHCEKHRKAVNERSKRRWLTRSLKRVQLEVKRNLTDSHQDSI